VPDSANVDEAVRALLAADATLAALIPDGVHMDVAPSGKKAFGIVSLVIPRDVPMMGGSAMEENLYLVKAVIRGNNAVNAKAAAARMHVLLEHQPLTITGYSHSLSRRVERVRYQEVDPADSDIRWQHQGGRYEVVVSP
jgi:hypothetical protein